MNPFELFALLTVLAAAFSWLNHRLLGLPRAVGLLALGLAFSLGLLGLGRLGLGLSDEFAGSVRALEFRDTLLDGMLGALLFAGALQVDLESLWRQRLPVAVTATGGVLLSTILVALGVRFAFGALGLELSWLYCLLFGALISPTDPVAVLGILKTAGVPASLETKIAGESLFNDGVAIVAFLVLAELATGSGAVSGSEVTGLLLREAIGGIAFGIGVGGLAYLMLASVDDHAVEVLITLALVAGGYALAQALHTSGPLAMVVAGLFIGNHGRAFAMSEHTREHLDTFWELLDELLNALLFVMIALEVVLVQLGAREVAAGLAAIPLVLAARFVSVGIAVRALSRVRAFSPHAVKILTWGGIKGGISVALALSLPPGAERDLLLAVTYLAVCFSVLVQGLSVGPLVGRLLREREA